MCTYNYYEDSHILLLWYSSCIYPACSNHTELYGFGTLELFVYDILYSLNFNLRFGTIWPTSEFCVTIIQTFFVCYYCTQVVHIYIKINFFQYLKALKYIHEINMFKYKHWHIFFWTFKLGLSHEPKLCIVSGQSSLNVAVPICSAQDRVNPTPSSTTGDK